MIGKNVENKAQKDNKKEKRIVEKMIERFRNPKLCPKDWEEFYKKVINININIYIVNKSKKKRIIFVRKIIT